MLFVVSACVQLSFSSKRISMGCMLQRVWYMFQCYKHNVQELSVRILSDSQFSGSDIAVVRYVRSRAKQARS